MTGAVLYFPWLMPSAQPVVINIVINPLAENLVLDREDIKEIINIYKNVK